MNRSNIIIILGAAFVLAAGIFLRFDGITRQGFIFHDEAVMFKRAETLRVHLLDQNPIIRKTENYTDTKILWLAFLLAGEWLTGGARYLPNILSAVFGMMTVALTYLFARRYFGTKDVAFLSAVFLTFSSYHVFYSRLGLPESAAAFFYLLTMYCYLIGMSARPSFVLLSGFLAGCAFMLNIFRVLTLPVVIFLLQISAPGTKEANLKGALKPFGQFLLLTVLTFFSYQGIHYLFSSWGIYIPPYLNGLKQTASFHMFVFPEIYSWLSFPLFIYSYESIGVCILLVASLFFYFKDERLQLPLFVVILAMVVYTLPDEKVARSLSVFLPFIAMVAARTYLNLLEGLGGRGIFRLLLSLFLAGTLGMALVQSREVSRFHSDLQPTMKHLDKTYDRPLVLVFNPIAQLFSEKTQRILSTESDYYDLNRFYWQGFDYLLIDPYARLAARTYADYRVTSDIEQFILDVEETCTVEYSSAHFSDELLKRYVYDHNRDLHLTQEWLRDMRRYSGRINVYGLQRCTETLNQKNTPDAS